ncbi:unnamed protein product [Linum trigynum]|uniref:Uncharacterized protein n=1 Tax=Linum trigynum TaxID=586398 RepID=A0AAV2GM67_9ROSI
MKQAISWHGDAQSFRHVNFATAANPLPIEELDQTSECQPNLPIRQQPTRTPPPPAAKRDQLPLAGPLIITTTTGRDEPLRDKLRGDLPWP